MTAIVCPYCGGSGRSRHDPDEYCYPCREDGYLEPGDDAYGAALSYVEEHGIKIQARG